MRESSDTVLPVPEGISKTQWPPASRVSERRQLDQGNTGGGVADSLFRSHMYLLRVVSIGSPKVLIRGAYAYCSGYILGYGNSTGRSLHCGSVCWFMALRTTQETHSMKNFILRSWLTAGL